MFSQINPLNIVKDHLKTLGQKVPGQKDQWNYFAIFVFLCSGLPIAGYQLVVTIDGYFLTPEAVGVIVSAASIIAGLLLNLLVLIYTLVLNQADSLKDARSLFIEVAKHTFYNISFTILASLVLVVVSLACLANNYQIKFAGNILTFYFGTITTISLLMVLKKCHKLIDFYFSKS